MSKSDTLIKLCELKKVFDGDVYSDVSIDRRGITDQIGKFYVVTKATPESTLADVVFNCNILGMMNMVRGELKEEKIVGFYKNINEAMEVGREELRKGKQ